MTPTENLHYAIGELAYAIAAADGVISREERGSFHHIIVQELYNEDYEFDISDIIFQMMDKEKISMQDAYERAMKQIRMNSHYLSPSLKAKFIRIIEKVAEAYEPVTIAEKELIERFKREIAPIIGDPVYYSGK